MGDHQRGGTCKTEEKKSHYQALQKFPLSSSQIESRAIEVEARAHATTADALAKQEKRFFARREEAVTEVNARVYTPLSCPPFSKYILLSRRFLIIVSTILFFRLSLLA